MRDKSRPTRRTLLFSLALVFLFAAPSAILAQAQGKGGGSGIPGCGGGGITGLIP